VGRTHHIVSLLTVFLKMKNSGVLPYALLILAVFYTACKKTPTVIEQNYFYVDQVYYQFKTAQLLNCLKKSSGPDSCTCLEKYWDGGNPQPVNDFPHDPVTSGGKEVHPECCPCNKVLSLTLDPTGGEQPTPDPGGVILECLCPGAALAVDSLHSLTLKFGPGKRIKSTGDLSDQIKKERVYKYDRTFYYYSFPDNFSDTVQVSFRNTDLGNIVVVKGKLENWLTNPK